MGGIQLERGGGRADGVHGGGRRLQGSEIEPRPDHQDTPPVGRTGVASFQDFTP